MDNFKKIVKILLFPKMSVLLICSVIGFPLMIYCLIYQDTPQIVSIPSYVLSAYAFTVICVNFNGFVKKTKALIKGDSVKIIVSFRRLMNSYKYTSMYLNDRDFRARISLYMSLLTNMAFAVFKCAIGTFYRSPWLWTIGIYYAILTAIRFTLMRNIRISDKNGHGVKKKIHEYKTYRTTGILMFLLNGGIAGMAVQMIWQNKSYTYAGFTIYISALYTFYCFISAIVNLIKFSRNENPILTASKNLSFMGAAMSMYTLQTAMIYAFDTNGDSFRVKMNIITGSAVTLFAVGLAVFMIIRANKNLKKLREQI